MKIKTFEEKFYDKFIYDEFDTTGLCILGNRKEDRPASGEEMIQFFTQQKQEMVEEVKGERDYSAEGESEAAERGKYDENARMEEEQAAQREYEQNAPPPEEPQF